MPLVVQKYGGTSLGNAERLQNVAHIIANTVKQHKVIVVVSAMSSYTKAEGTTSRLWKLAISRSMADRFSEYWTW